MNITLLPPTVEDYLGRKHIRGILASQEVFETDMLNRILVELCNDKLASRVRAFMRVLWQDAKPPSDHRANFAFDPLTRETYEACVEKANPVVGLAVLRQARHEQIVLQEIWDIFGLDMLDQARAEAADYIKPDLGIGTAINGAMQKDTVQKIYRLTGKEILAFTPDMYSTFIEFLQTPYAVQDNLLTAARLLIARCYSLKELERLYSNKMRNDGYATFAMQTHEKLEAARQAYLQRHIALATLNLTGTCKSSALTPMEAHTFHNKVFEAERAEKAALKKPA